ncbi:hypothetical protein TSUD_24740 [Trifolium subterraneum]|uniref:Uncharacterized protein n=1 Tax=Trifolium subterraneum TaxID=3900 RepID=A0A2Z6NL77_TRISU|nr:hypothetical protein TSUD_24740 [Trifolium subterraneum]
MSTMRIPTDLGVAFSKEPQVQTPTPAKTIVNDDDNTAQSSTHLFLPSSPEFDNFWERNVLSLWPLCSKTIRVESPTDINNRRQISSVVINLGASNLGDALTQPEIHLEDPPNIVPVPPPPLAPPWIYNSVFTISLNSPPLIIASNTGNFFHFDPEVLTRAPSQFDNPIDLQLIKMLRENSVSDTSIVTHVFLLPFYACPAVISLITIGGYVDFGISASHTYQLFVKRPLKVTSSNIVCFHDMKTLVTKLQTSSQNFNITLGSVLFACNTFESLLFDTQGMSSLVQNYSTISVECKDFAFGSAIEFPVVSLGLTKLVDNGHFSPSSFLVGNHFGYIVSPYGYMRVLDCYGLVLLQVLISENSVKRIKSIIIDFHKRVLTIIKPNPVIIPPLKPPAIVVLPLSQLSTIDHDCEDADNSDLIPPMNPPPKPPDWIDIETSSLFPLRWSDRFLEKQRGQVIIVHINIGCGAAIFFHNSAIYHNCSPPSGIGFELVFLAIVGLSIISNDPYVNYIDSTRGVYPYLYESCYDFGGVCYSHHASNFGEDTVASAIDVSIWLKSANFSDQLAALNSKHYFMVVHIGIYTLFSMNLSNPSMAMYWFHEHDNLRFGRLIYVAFRTSGDFAYWHKEHVDAIYSIHVGSSLGNILVTTKFDNYQIHLNVLLTKRYDMENWDLWQAGEYLLMKQDSFVCTFQPYQLVAMTMNTFITFIQPTKHRGILTNVGVYFTLAINGPTYAISFTVISTGFQCSNLNQFLLNVSFAFQIVYFFKKLRLDFGEGEAYCYCVFFCL